jgi:hypothetical protein
MNKLGGSTKTFLWYSNIPCCDHPHGVSHLLVRLNRFTGSTFDNCTTKFGDISFKKSIVGRTQSVKVSRTQRNQLLRERNPIFEGVEPISEYVPTIILFPVSNTSCQCAFEISSYLLEWMKLARKQVQGERPFYIYKKEGKSRSICPAIESVHFSLEPSQDHLLSGKGQAIQVCTRLVNV